MIANNGTAVQMILPNFMRARGMAVHQMVFFGADGRWARCCGARSPTLFGTQAALIVSAAALVPLDGASPRRSGLPGSPLPRALTRTGCCVFFAPQDPKEFPERGRILL